MEEASRIIDQEDLGTFIQLVQEEINDTDYTSMDIAAALLKMCTGTAEENEVENFEDTGAEEPGMVRLFINIGKKHKAKPGDILGAIAGESGMPGKVVGTIDMYDKYTFVEVPREYAKEVLSSVNHTKIKGKAEEVEPANRK